MKRMQKGPLCGPVFAIAERLNQFLVKAFAQAKRSHAGALEKSEGMPHLF
jgi:hypothetical protein